MLHEPIPRVSFSLPGLRPRSVSKQSVYSMYRRNVDRSLGRDGSFLLDYQRHGWKRLKPLDSVVLYITTFAIHRLPYTQIFDVAR